MMMNKTIEILETSDFKLEKPTFILGFPDVGLVGTIACYHLIEKLNLKEIAHIDSKKFPPVVVVHDSIPSSPIRIYGDEAKNIGVVISEIPISADLIPLLSRALAEWFREKGALLVISLGGVPHPKRLEAEKLKVYGISSLLEREKKTWKKTLNDSGVEPFHEGILVGIHGIMLRECTKQGVNSLYLMTESHYHYPDPEAAATVIEILNKILNLNVGVKELLEKGEEIKIKARDLMRRTQDEMKQMQKSQEHEIPMMYR
jgi:uncharacterized protein